MEAAAGVRSAAGDDLRFAFRRRMLDTDVEAAATDRISGILQVSLSQLRKWRMKEQAGKQQGPPFKKVGRLVRYPQRALQAYIDGD
jgi:transposase-like protein